MPVSLASEAEELRENRDYRVYQMNDIIANEFSRIDKQHFEFIEMIDVLYTSIMTEENNTSMLQITSYLADYSKFHFETEESLMKRINYPEYDKHLVEHNAFRNYIELVTGNLELPDKQFNLDLLLYMKNWLVAHIRYTDSEIFKYFETLYQTKKSEF